MGPGIEANGAWFDKMSLGLYREIYVQILTDRVFSAYKYLLIFILFEEISFITKKKQNQYERSSRVAHMRMVQRNTPRYASHFVML